MNWRDCYRKVCKNNANCYNSSTKEYYCIPCARKINEYAGKEICDIKSPYLISPDTTGIFDNLIGRNKLHPDYDTSPMKNPEQ